MNSRFGLFGVSLLSFATLIVLGAPGRASGATVYFVPRDINVFEREDADRITLDYKNADAQCRYETIKESLEQGLAAEASSGLFVLCMQAHAFDPINQEKFDLLVKAGTLHIPPVKIVGWKVDF